MKNHVIIYLSCVLIFTTLYILSFRLDWFLQFGLYGVVMLLYFLIQIISSRYNRKFYSNMGKIDCKNVILLVVGHRENSEYWEKCLESILLLDPSTPLEAVYIVVDGDEEEDKKMYQQAVSFFTQKDYDFKLNINHVYKRGKRGVMAYGFNKIRFDYYHILESEIDVVVTDSDTILEKNSLIKLEECLRSDPRNGCATGSLYVFNTSSLLCKIINIRYKYAFDFERSCASYYGCMSCCSGPLSIYKLSTLDNLLLQKFVDQSIGGVKCEPGDDRHLTNLVMAKGYLSRQTEFAIAGTEAPETLFRYILQQMRWNRSFYRELKWQIKCIPLQSSMLFFMSIYELLFPYFVAIFVMYSLFYSKHTNFTLYSIFISLGVIVCKSIILSLCLCKNFLLFSFFYYLLYFSILLPLKIFSFFTVLNNSWVTPSRNKIFSCLPSCSIDAQLAVIFIICWNVMIIFGILYRFFPQLNEKNLIH